MCQQIEVISAREEYGQLEPNLWKIACFKDLDRSINLKTNQIANFVIVGDSMNEINAG